MLFFCHAVPEQAIPSVNALAALATARGALMLAFLAGPPGLQDVGTDDLSLPVRATLRGALGYGIAGRHQ